MATARFWFAETVGAAAVREALRREVGRSRASERAIEIDERDGA